MSIQTVKRFLKTSVIKSLNLLPVTSITFGSPRRVANAAEINFKNRPLDEYIPVIPKQTILEKPPGTIDKEVFFKYEPFYSRKTPEQYILKLNNGRVWGRNGAIITEDDIFIKDLSKEFGPAKLNPSLHSIFHRIKLQKPKIFNGALAVLTSPGPNVYAHWFCDIMPRLMLLKQEGILEKVDKILINFNRLDFQLETLAHLGIPEEKLLISGDDPEFHIQANTLYVASHPNEHGTVNPWASKAVKSIFKTAKNNSAKPRFYISRSKAVGRNMLHEEELFQLLEQEYGFEKIFTEEHNMQEKAALFGSAECVVAPHGGGLTNIIFCNPGCKIIDIFPPGDFTTYFWSLANSNKLDYYYFFGRGNRPTKENDFKERNANIDIDITQFKKLLEATKLEKRKKV